MHGNAWPVSQNEVRIMLTQRIYGTIALQSQVATHPLIHSRMGPQMGVMRIAVSGRTDLCKMVISTHRQCGN